MNRHQSKRTSHRIIPSILLREAIPDYEGSFLAKEEHNNNKHHHHHHSVDTHNSSRNNSSSEDDDDDEQNNHNHLNYKFTTQSEEMKQQTKSLFNRVRLADKVVHNFVTHHEHKQYVYGQSLKEPGGVRRAQLEKRKNRQNKEDRYYGDEESETTTNDSSSLSAYQKNKRGLTFAVGDPKDKKSSRGSSSKKKSKKDNNNNNNNGDDDDGVENNDDDDVKRLLGDDWKTGDGDDGDEDASSSDKETDDKKNTKQDENQAKSLSENEITKDDHYQQQQQQQPQSYRRRRLPNMLDVASDVARKNRRINLHEVSKAMSRQEDNKKAKAMIHYDSGVLLTQRRQLIERQNDLQDLIEEQDSKNYVLAGLRGTDCLTTVTEMKSKSHEILSEEYFNPSRHAILNIPGAKDDLVMRLRRNMVTEGGGSVGANNNNNGDLILKHQLISPSQQQSSKNNLPTKIDDFDKKHQKVSKEEEHRLSRKSDFLRQHKPEFLIEDTYRRMDEFIAAEDDDDFIENSVEMKKDEYQHHHHHQDDTHHNNNNQPPMLSPLDFLNNHDNDKKANLSFGATASSNGRKLSSSESCSSKSSSLAKKSHLGYGGTNRSSSRQPTTTATTHHHVTFVSQAHIQHSIQQTLLDEEQQRHLILREEQQFCRSIVESYRNYHVLSVQPFLEAERFAQSVAAEMQRDVDGLEVQLRVGTHKKEVMGNHHDNEEKNLDRPFRYHDDDDYSSEHPYGKNINYKSSSKSSDCRLEEEDSESKLNKAEEEKTLLDVSGTTVSKKNEHESADYSTASSFTISPAGYSILSSLGEQMDKLRAEIESDKVIKNQQQQQQNTNNNTDTTAAGVKNNARNSEDEHHQSIVFRAKKMMKDKKKNLKRQGTNNDDANNSKNNRNLAEDDDELTKAATAMAEALEVAQNQQTALTLSKVPQLCAFLESSASSAYSQHNLKNPSILKYCEYAKQYTDNQLRQQKEAAERAHANRHALGGGVHHHHHRYSKKREKQNDDDDDDDDEEDQDDYEASAIRDAPPPSIVASKRWAEVNGLLLSSSSSGNNSRKDHVGIAVVSSLHPFFGGKKERVPIIAGCDLSTSEPCHDIFYPRFIAFEDFDERQEREDRLKSSQAKVSKVAVLSRDARAQSAKARKGVVQCIYQQAPLFQYDSIK